MKNHLFSPLERNHLACVSEHISKSNLETTIRSISKDMAAYEKKGNYQKLSIYKEDY